MTDVQICDSVAREYITGWGESNMELLEKARTDIADAQVLLKSLRQEVESMAEIQYPRLTEMALDKLRTAYARIDMLHNELDVEREFGPEFGHDAQQLDSEH